MAPDGHNAEGTQGSPSVDRSGAPYAVAPETLAAEAREASDSAKVSRDVPKIDTSRTKRR